MFIFKQEDISNYLDVESNDLTITNLLSKYNIKTENSFLYNLNDDYTALVDFIATLYIEKKQIPEDIKKELTSNIKFKSFLLFNIKERMKNILSDNTTVVYKEIITIVNLLSFGKKFEIFENYNFYNIKELGLLFRDFEENLKTIKDIDEKDFDITFEQYSLLIEVINELCTINSTDVSRKKTIAPLMETISETINIIKFSVQLNENQLNTLNNILGKLLFYYSHVPFINTSNKDAQYLIDEFKFNFEKICDGYHLSKNAGFGNDQKDEEYYKVFLNSSTTLLSTLIFKLEMTYNFNEYNEINKFKDIISLYNEELIHNKLPTLNSVDELKTEILKNYNFIYGKNINSDNYLFVIDDFLENPDFNSSNMHILHSLVLFSSYIEDKKLLKILKTLIAMDKFKNDYHEFYKLNVCDVIINRFTYDQNQLLNNDLINEIISYIEKNKIASHLMSIYSKIYLSLSLYYSFYDDYKSIEKSKLFYFNYVSINGVELLENEFQNLNRDILLNHGKKYIQDLELDNVSLSNGKAIQIGAKTLEKYFKKQELNLKYDINQKLSNIITEIFTDEGLNDKLLNGHIENFISRDIFHGLTYVWIEGLSEDEIKLDDLGYESIQIDLIDKYKLNLAYSTIYKHIFKNIYEKNKEYIKQNIINLIISYIKSIPIYHDPITKLFNIDKLRNELIKKDNNELILVEIYIEDLMSLNRKYSYQRVNEMFKNYTSRINSFVDIYRFNGPKFGFLLEKYEDYKSIIEDIKEVEIGYEKDKIIPNLTIAVSWGNKENIIEKSAHCVSIAHTKKEKYYEFK